jgi:hypothetical protein
MEIASLLIIILLIIINIGLFIFFLYYYYSFNFFNFYDSFRIVVAPTLSGCANITILYAVPLIIFIYIYGLLLSLTGIFKGREYSLFNWYRLINWFNNRIKR